MPSRELGSRLLAVISVCCAISVVGLMIRQQFFAPLPPGVRLSTPPTRIKNWAQYAAVGHRMGPDPAPVTIVEFADFQCPVCRQFVTQSLRGVIARHAGQVAVVFRHWPLPYHRQAYSAARAAECAAAQGRFEQFYNLIYDQQDSLGLKPFIAFGRDAGVVDAPRFAKCVTDTGKVSAVERDVAAALELKGEGTPLLLINGTRFTGAPDSTHLDSIVVAAMHRAR